MPEEINVSTLNKKCRPLPKPRKKNDELLKGAFEDNFPDFLRFVYTDAKEILDFEKGIEFMDKELHAIIPDRERKKDKRVADLLAKLYLKDGTENGYCSMQKLKAVTFRNFLIDSTSTIAVLEIDIRYPSQLWLFLLEICCKYGAFPRCSGSLQPAWD